MDKSEAWQMLSGILQAAQMMPPVQRAAPGSLPLTVIGGFLGAGKTTLLNHLLGAPHGRRLAVLVNDFGPINIDAALIRSRTEDTISLVNGCACCSVAGDLTRALIELAQRDEPPDAIVLEASGLADPHGIAQVALANPALRLDGVLAVVDAETLLEHASDSPAQATFLAQLSAADVIVLNKLDLVPAEGRIAARAWLQCEQPGRPIVEAVHGEVPVEVALGIHSERELPHGRALDSGHDGAYQSWSVAGDAKLDADRVREMMDGLGEAIVRAKGILWVASDPDQRTVYQRVGTRGSFSTAGRWDGEAPRSSLVVIGLRSALQQPELERRFDACRAGLSP